jgi:hypothetical protein
LLASLLTPLSRSDAEVEAECAWLNFIEASSWTGFPQLGGRVPLAKGDDLYPGHAFFIPNLLFQPNLATNAALWQMARARWVKQTFHAHLQDRTMMEILQARHRLRGRGPD